MGQMARVMKDNTGKIREPDLLMCLGLVDGLLMGNPMQEDSNLICIDCRDPEGKDDPEEIPGTLKHQVKMLEAAAEAAASAATPARRGSKSLKTC